MRSPARMARAMRSMAAGMSRMESGSCSSSKAGCRKRGAVAGSENPRCTSTLAAGGPIRRAAESAETASGSGAGNSQRAGGLTAGLILGVIAAKRVAFVLIALGHGARDLVFGDQEFLVPVGLEFVHVEVGIVVERQLQRAGHALVDAHLAQAVLVVALLVAVHADLLDLLQQVVDVAGLEFAGGEEDHLDAGLDGGVQEHPVVGIMLAVPEHHLGVFEDSRGAAENGQIARFEIVQDFALECIEIQVHVASSAYDNTRVSEGLARSRAEGVTIVFGPI